MNRLLILAAAVGGILLSGSSTGGITDAARAAPEIVPAGQPVAQDPGAAVFRRKGNCATCHGADARGSPLGPNLTDEVWLNSNGTLAEITEIIRVGVAKPKQYPAPMPAMGGARLRPAEVEAVARYVLNLQRSRPDTGG